MVTFSSKAWLLDGPIDSLPGLLNFDGQQLRYLIVTEGTFPEAKLDELLLAHGKQSAEFPIELFSVNRDEVSSFKIPWYYFNGGAKVLINHRPYRFSFVRPQNTVEPSHYSGHLHQWIGGAGQEEIDIPAAQSAGRKWKQILAR